MRARPALLLAVALSACAVLAIGAQSTVRLAVMSSGGFTAAYAELTALFTANTGIEVDTVYGASMGGATSSIPSRLDRGEPADVVILAREGLDRLAATGQVVPNSRVNLATSAIGMAIREGAPPPDISTVDAFTRTLLEAESLAYSASASGTYLSTVLFPRLGIADKLADKSTRVVDERVGAVVARGDAAIGFQQVSELLPIAGITYVGPIPDDLQQITMFSAGVTIHAKAPEAAARLIAFLSSPRAAPIIARTGMTPSAGTVAQ
ncbi:MAG: substrate-binding domain-containing protein [Acidobacteria bacterium]|nr:substrate-binding domain-containing protein [Acidobacteriota bacterium]